MITRPETKASRDGNILALFCRLTQKMGETLMDPRNAEKGDWHRMGDDDIVKGLRDEMRELADELDADAYRPLYGQDDGQLDRIEHEAVDVANFAAFIVERIAEIREFRRPL